MLIALGARRAAVASLLLGLAVVVAACGGDDAGSAAPVVDERWSPRAVAETLEGASVMPVHVGMVGVGPTRLVFGLFARDGAMISDIDTASLRLYSLDPAGEEMVTGTVVSEHLLTAVTMGRSLVHTHADGGLHTHEAPAAALFVTSVDFTHSGWWGAEVDVRGDGVEADGVRLRFWVAERTPEPMIGEAAPRSSQRVLRDVDDIAEIDTANPPNRALHELTVAEALDTGRPVVIAFATPAFCQSQFCGPVIDVVVRPLWERYRGQVEFLHIEPFDIAEARSGRLVAVPATEEWGLPSEPWVFVIDGEGRVAAKFEGITNVEEVEAALRPLLADAR